MKRTTDMTLGSPIKLILTFAFPLILANLGQQLYMMIDAVIVGRGVGVHALASVGATDWCYWLILWSIYSITQGFATFVSRYFGEKNFAAMNKTIAMSVILCALIGSVLTVLGIVVARPLLVLLNTPADIIDGAVTYLITLVSGSIIVMMYNMTASILRALGDGKTPLIAMIIAAVLNIALDLLFVFVFHWGIFGAALASVISQTVSFVVCLISVIKVECIHLSRETFRLDLPLIKSMLLFGMPLMAEYFLISFGGIILQSAINLQGSAFIAGYTATNKIYGLLESSAVSLGLACCTYFAQNFGAKNHARIHKGARDAFWVLIAMAAVSMTITGLFRQPIMQLFLDVSQEGGIDALGIAIHYLTIILICLPLLYLIHLYRNLLQAIGVAKWSLISGFAEFVVRVLMSMVVIRWLGSDALFVAEPLAWLGALLCVMLPYFYYRKTRLK